MTQHSLPTMVCGAFRYSGLSQLMTLRLRTIYVFFPDDTVLWASCFLPAYLCLFSLLFWLRVGQAMLVVCWFCTSVIRIQSAKTMASTRLCLLPRRRTTSLIFAIPNCLYVIFDSVQGSRYVNIHTSSSLHC